jgi:hypothetical protein
MSRYIKWFACVGIALLVVIVGQIVRNRLKNREIPPEAVVLRQRFPYVSLTGRLEFEAKRLDGDSASDLALSDTVLEQLQKVAAVYDSSDSQARALALRELHSNEVRWFSTGPRNGLSRWGQMPTPNVLEYDEPPSIPVLAGVAESAIEQSPGTENL